MVNWPNFDLPVYWHEPVKDVKEFKERIDEMKECSGRFVESLSDPIFKDADGKFWLQQEVVVIKTGMLPLNLDIAEAIEENRVLLRQTKEKKD